MTALVEDAETWISHAEPRRAWWASRYAPLKVHAPLLLIAFGAHWLINDPPTTLYISGVVAFITYIALAVIESRRAPLWLSPLTFYFVWYSIELGPAALHFASKIEGGEAIRLSARIVYADDFAMGYLLFLVGSFALHAGMQVTRPLPDQHAALPPPPGSMWGFALLWLVGMFVRFFGHLAGGFGAIVGIVYWGPLAALAAFALTQGAGTRRTTSFWLIVVTGTAIEFATNLRAGSKAYLMFSFLPLAWLFSRDRKLRRWLPALAGGLVVLYLGVIAPIVSASRLNAAYEGETPGDRIVRTYSEGSYGENSRRPGESADVAEQAGAFFERLFEPTPVGFLYGDVERLGLRYGETMDYLAYAFIPRIFWEDKPGVSRGTWFNVYLGGARTERESAGSTSVGQTAAGELYWNFGVPGIVLGLCLIGALFGLLWRLATAHSEQEPVRMLLYLSVMFNMIDMSEAGSVLVGIAYRAVVLVPAVLLVNRAARASESA